MESELSFPRVKKKETISERESVSEPPWPFPLRTSGSIIIIIAENNLLQVFLLAQNQKEILGACARYTQLLNRLKDYLNRFNNFGLLYMDHI